MDIAILKEILVIIAPIVAEIAVVIIGLAIIFNKFGKIIDAFKTKEQDTLKKVNKNLDSIAILKAKIESIEKHIVNGGKK